MGQRVIETDSSSDIRFSRKYNANVKIRELIITTLEARKTSLLIKTGMTLPFYIKQCSFMFIGQTTDSSSVNTFGHGFVMDSKIRIDYTQTEDIYRMWCIFFVPQE